MEKVVEIQHFLPHRKPMLMVDYIMAMDRQNVVTTFSVKEDNVFTDAEQLTEPGLIENAAQTCSAIVAKSYFVDEDDNVHKKDVIGFISSIKKIVIHSLPKIGCEIVTKAQLVSRFDTGEFITCMMNCRSYCDGELLLEGDINLFIREAGNERE
jgi:predicted hotdog family 3-hydroxylacyl-ACP dehydratase